MEINHRHPSALLIAILAILAVVFFEMAHVISENRTFDEKLASGTAVLPEGVGKGGKLDMGTGKPAVKWPAAAP